MGFSLNEYRKQKQGMSSVGQVQSSNKPFSLDEYRHQKRLESGYYANDALKKRQEAEYKLLNDSLQNVNMTDNSALLKIKQQALRSKNFFNNNSFMYDDLSDANSYIDSLVQDIDSAMQHNNDVQREQRKNAKWQSTVDKYNAQHPETQYLTNVSADKMVEGAENAHEYKQANKKSAWDYAKEFFSQGHYGGSTYTLGDAVSKGLTSTGKPVAQDSFDGYSEDTLGALEIAAANSGKNPLTAAQNAAVQTDDTKRYTYMTDEEKSYYNRLYGARGAEAAERYHNGLLSEINKRIADDKYAESYENLNPAAKTGVMFAQGVQSGLRGLGNVGETVLGIDRTKATPVSDFVASNIRNDADNSAVANVVYDIAQSSGYMTPGVVAGMLTGGAGNVVFALSQYGNSYREAIDQGESTNTASLYAMQQGIDETATNLLLGGVMAFGGGALTAALGNKGKEKFIQALGTAVSTDRGKWIVGSLFKAMANMSGEAAQEYLQFFTQNWTQALLGMKDENGNPIQANFNLLDGEALYSAMLGALNAAVLNAPYTAAEIYHAPKTQTNTQTAPQMADPNVVDAAYTTTRQAENTPAAYQQREAMDTVAAQEQKGSRVAAELAAQINGVNVEDVIQNVPEVELPQSTQSVRVTDSEGNISEAIAALTVQPEVVQQMPEAIQPEAIQPEAAQRMPEAVQPETVQPLSEEAQQQTVQPQEYSPEIRQLAQEAQIPENAAELIRQMQEPAETAINAPQTREMSQAENITPGAAKPATGDAGASLTTIEQRSKQFPEKAAAIYRDNYNGGDIVEYDENMKKAYTVGLKGEEYSSLFNDFYVSNADAVDAMWRAGSTARIANSTQSAPKKVVRDAGELTRLATEKKYTQRKATVRKASANYSEKIAKVFVDNYDPSVIPSTYRKGFEMAYQAGLARAAVDELDESVSDMLSHDQIMAAYNAGRSESYGDERYSRNAEVTESTAKTTEQRRSQEKSGLVRDENTKKAGLGSTNEKVLDHYGKAVEAEIRFAPHIYDEYGNEANGSYADGVITISLNSNDPYMTVFWHEAIHRLRSINADAYTQLRDFVADAMGDEYFSHLLGAYESVYHGDKAYVSEEIVADAMGRIGSEEEATRRFAENHKDLARTLLDILKDIINAIKRMFTGKTDKELSQEQRDVMKPIYDRMQEAVSLLDQAISSAAEQRFTYSELTSKPDMQLTHLDSDIPNTRDGIVKAAKENAKQVGKVENGTISVHVNDIGKDVVIGTSGLKHSLYRGLDQIGAVTVKAGEILQNSVEINELTPKKKEASGSYVLLGAGSDNDGNIYIVRSVVNRFTSEMVSMDVLYAIDTKKENQLRSMRPGIQPPVTGSTISIADLLEYANKYFPDVLSRDVLQHFGRDSRPDGELGKNAKYSYLNDIDKATQLFEVARVPMPKVPQVRPDGFVHSIRESGSTVKAKFGSVTETQQFKRWFGDWKNHPENASKVVNTDGTPRVVYHGTPDKTFTTFDTSKTESGSLGKGFYFAGSEEYAKGHTIVNGKFDGRVIEAYLNVRNPYVVNSPGNIDTEKLMKRGYDAVYHPGNDFWVVFSPEQIKSAIDNIGTFDRKNPDIRFSMSVPVEETKDLLAVHNLSAKNLTDALELGGLPMPSIAVVKAKNGHEKYGDISLVFSKNTIDPQLDKRNKVYGADAWTPTAPSVEYEVNDKKRSAVENELYNLAKDVAGGIFAKSSILQAKGIDDSYSGTYAQLAEELAYTDAAQAAYLAEHGRSLEPVMKDKVWNPYGNEILQAVIDRIGVQELKAINDRIFNGVGINKTLGNNKEIIRGILREYYGAIGEEMLQKMAKRRGWTEAEISEKREARIDAAMGKVTLFTLEDIVEDAWNMYQDGGKTKGEIDRFATADALKAAVRGEDVKSWIEEKIDGLLGNRGISNGKDPYTASGSSRSFSQLHYAYTLENIVKAMQKTQAARGAHVVGIGATTLQAVASPEYNSIQEIKADSYKLGKADTEEYDAKVKALDDKIAEVIERIVSSNPSQGSNSFIERDIIGEVMLDAAKGKKTVDSIVKAFRDNSAYKISTQIAQEIQNIYREAANLPTEYFEAKAQRAVGFDEVLAAVIPDNSSAELRQAIRKAGMPIVEYHAGDEDDRVKKLNSIEGARFSKNVEVRFDQEVDDKEVSRLENIRKANSHIRYMNDVFDATVTAVTGKNTLSGAAQRAVDNAIKIYGSTADTAELTDTLQTVYDYLSASSKADAQEVYSVVHSIAEDIVSQAQTKNSDMDKLYPGLRKQLRTTKLKVSDTIKNSIPDYNDFRKANFGMLKLASNDGIEVDSFYEELSDQHPELFPAEVINDTDRLITISEVAGLLKPQMVDGIIYGGGIMNEQELEAETAALAQKLMNGFFGSMNTVDNTAKYEATIKALKAEHESEIARYKASEEWYRKAYGQWKASTKAWYSKAYAEWKGNTKDWYTNAYKQWKERYTERNDLNAAKKRIISDVKAMTRMLSNPTDAKHVPEVLRVDLANFLSKIDFSSDYVHPSGELTQRTQDWLKIQNTLSGIINSQANAIQTGDGVAYIDIDPDIVANMQSLNAAVEGGKRLNDMTKEELRALRETMIAMKKCIEGANKFILGRKNETVASRGDATIAQLGRHKNHTNSTNTVLRTFDKLFTDDMLDSDARFYTMGKAGYECYKALRHGLNTKIFDIQAVSRFFEQVREENGLKRAELDDWASGKIVNEVELSGGRKIKLTPAIAMNIYALSKREQAMGHMLGDGIVIAPFKQGGKYVEQGRIQLTKDDIRKIIGTLTDQQKAVQNAISENYKMCAAWGNEASMQMYGYEKFNAPDYTAPIETDRDFLPTNTKDVIGNYDIIKNYGFTKSTVEGAKNPIKIRSTFDVYVDHVNKMSNYHAFLAPLSDLQKWFNYRAQDGNGSVRLAIKTALGQDANEYILKLMRNINGFKMDDTYFAKPLISLYKGSAVGFNISVAVQQPTSYLRAMAVVPQKYLLKGLAPTKLKVGTYEDIENYSAIAQWKDWGFFETDVGRSLKSILLGQNTGIKSLNDKQMWLAGKGDEIAWTAMWRACEYWVEDTEPDVEVGSEEYFHKVADKFDMIIDKTQVVDSPLHRAEIMRSGSELNQLATSFMSEPMKSYNTMYRAIYDAKNPEVNGKSKIDINTSLIAALIGWIAANTLAAAAKSLISALRDDDKDKEYWDRWNEAFIDEAIGNLNPMSYIPWVKDIYSILSGYDSSRMDLQLGNDLNYLISRWKKRLDGTSAYTIANDILYSARIASRITGIGFYSLQRDINGVIDEAIEMLGADDIAYEKSKTLKYDIGVSGNMKHYTTMAIKAYVNGNKVLGDKIIKDMLDAGIDEEKLNAKLKDLLKANPEWAKQVHAAGGGVGQIAAQAQYASRAAGATKKDEKVEVLMDMVEDGSITKDEFTSIYEAAWDTKALSAYKEMGGNAYDFAKYDVGSAVSESRLRKMQNRGMKADTLLEYLTGQSVASYKDVPSKSFNSYKELKEGIGDSDNNENWHHLVEQSSAFDVRQVQNVNNIVSIPTGTNSVHAKITAYYNSKQSFTGGRTVREWLSGKDFMTQWTFGRDLLLEYGTLIPTSTGWYFIPQSED